MTKELTTHKLPKLTDLYSDKEEMIKIGQLNAILNAEPKGDWVKEHPFVKGLKYLPIERVEYLLTVIFGTWRVEIIDTKLLANSVTVTVRLFVRNPLDGEWMYNDGVGAQPIQIEKGSGAIEFDKMNRSAIQIGLPAAKSYAVKDAAEMFGKIFGKDLNRKDTMGYLSQITSTIDQLTPTNQEELDKIKLVIEETSDLESLNVAWINLSAKFRESAEVKELFNLKKKTYENIPNTTTKNS